MRNGTPQISSCQRTLAMLEAVIADGGTSSITALAQQTGVPLATAHRQITTLAANGYLMPSASGGHVAGVSLLRLFRLLDEKQLLANVAAPVLQRLAKDVRCVAQLGTLENQMVTYRVKAGKGANALFTRIGMQLEAYCSAIGKVLLAHLPDAEHKDYLASGPFVPLTPQTITEPVLLAEELKQVRRQGFAVDDGEVAVGLMCIAVPVRDHGGRVFAAISVSQSEPKARRFGVDEFLSRLCEAAFEIEQAVFR